MVEFSRTLAAGLFLLTLPSPVFAQPITEDEVDRKIIASYDYKELPPVKTIQGMASILVERHCQEDASGSLIISLYAGDFDPKKGTLWIEAHPVNADGGTLAEVRDSAEVKSPIEKAVITMPKETRFMVQIKEKLTSITSILREFDVVHYCQARGVVGLPLIYEYSDDFQEQLFINSLSVE